MKVCTIGFTKESAKRFFELLRVSGARRVVDVRLNNVSQLAGFAKKDDLAYFLREICGMDYVHLPTLAPTQEMLDRYRKYHGDWKSYELQFLELMRQRRIEETTPRAVIADGCLLCSEDKPHHCHRRLVAEYLKQHWGDIDVSHLGAQQSPLRSGEAHVIVFPDDAALAALCRRYHIRRLSLFGSTLKGTNRPDSDVDLLVEFEPGATPGLLTMAQIEIDLSVLLDGRKVDLRTAGDLSRYFRDEVVRTAEPQFDARSRNPHPPHDRGCKDGAAVRRGAPAGGPRHGHDAAVCCSAGHSDHRRGGVEDLVRDPHDNAVRALGPHHRHAQPAGPCL
jgi:predicted nucleotidyltransferase